MVMKDKLQVYCQVVRNSKKDSKILYNIALQLHYKIHENIRNTA